MAILQKLHVDMALPAYQISISDGLLEIANPGPTTILDLIFHAP
jgi:hypothetical protein